MKTILIFLFVFVNTVTALYKLPAAYSQKKESAKTKVDSLMKLLPEKLVTIVDKTLDDQFAQIETVVTTSRYESQDGFFNYAAIRKLS